MATKIEWTMNEDGTPGEPWSPIRGCTRISPGCGGGLRGPNGEQGGCYAEVMATRFSWAADPTSERKAFRKAGPFNGFAERRDGKPRWTGKVALIPELLDVPLRKRKPTTFFMSMTDLFHEALTNEEIAAVFGVMAATPRHTYQILTKRSGRMREWFAWVDSRLADHGAAPGSSIHPFAVCTRAAREHVKHADLTDEANYTKRRPIGGSLPWPLPNLWLGVSVEMARYKGRFDDLRACPAAVRFACRWLQART